MAKFNINDKVTVLSGNPLWFEKEGTVTDIDEKGNVKVDVQFISEDDGELKIITNIFPEDELQLSKENESLKEGVNNMEELKLSESELQQWMDDNDANYWDREISEDGTVAIRGICETLGTYNFNTHVLKLNENYSLQPEYKEDEDFIKDYVEYIDEEGHKVYSWYFIDKIAVAEGVDECCVYETACRLNYKLFSIEAAPTFSKIVVAGKTVKAKDIYNDYAAYLQGRVTVTELNK